MTADLTTGWKEGSRAMNTDEDDKEQEEYLRMWIEKHPDYGKKRKIRFTVPGDPVGKERPRFDPRTKRTYTPAKTTQYQELVSWSFEQVSRGKFYGEGAIKMKIMAFYPIPVSTSKVRRGAMLLGILRPTKKPDTDNVAKIIADSLNGVAYHDDAAVVEMNVQKWYSDRPRVEVTIESMKQGD
jgi:Holliday junction resolvase RusA-like endonuclease